VNFQGEGINARDIVNYMDKIHERVDSVPKVTQHQVRSILDRYDTITDGKLLLTGFLRYYADTVQLNLRLEFIRVWVLLHSDFINKHYVTVYNQRTPQMEKSPEKTAYIDLHPSHPISNLNDKIVGLVANQHSMNVAVPFGSASQAAKRGVTLEYENTFLQGDQLSLAHFGLTEGSIIIATILSSQEFPLTTSMMIRILILQITRAFITTVI